ncbi:MAG: EamA family transporter [Actinobacteria bacterium]|nr:EamA family transporter [Actinomycetota bacterium]
MSVTRIPSGYLYAALGTLVFSFTLPMVKIALPSFDPWTITFTRMTIAGTVAAIVVVVTRTPFPARHLWKSILLTGLGISLGFPIFSTLAMQRTTAAHGAVIIAGLPLVTAMFGVLTHKDKVPRLFWVGAILGTSALVVYAWYHGGSEHGDPVADLLLVAAVLSSAYGYSEGARLTKVMPNWQVVTWCVVMYLPLSAIAAAVSFGATHSQHTIEPKGIFGLLFISFGSMYLGFFAWYRGLAELGVARGSQVQMLQPILTLCWSAMILGETISASALVTAAVVLSSILLTQRARSVKPPAQFAEPLPRG